MWVYNFLAVLCFLDDLLSFEIVNLNTHDRQMYSAGSTVCFKSKSKPVFSIWVIWTLKRLARETETSLY